MAIPTRPTAGSAATVSGALGTDDYLLGTSGDDIITGGASSIAYIADGIDIMQGGAGDDQYIVNNTTGSDSVIEVANEGVDTIFASVNYTLPGEVENIVATGGDLAAPAAVTLTGNTLANILDGSQSSQTDKLKGMEGSDTYIVGTGDKVIEGRAGTGTTATYTDPGGIDTIISKSTANVDLSPLITATGQIDTGVTSTISRTEATGTIAGAISIVGAAFIENVVLDAAAAGADITGNAKDNRLTGNSTAGNTINGGAGNDTLDGGGGGDALTGGLGNDTYIKRHASDTFIESLTTGGTDTIISALVVDISAVANIENITLTGITGGINATGNSLANTLKGNSVGNVLTGGAGIDTLYGLQGGDTLDGGSGNDIMYGGRGNDVYYVDSVGDVVNEVGALADGTADLVKSTVTYTLNTVAADQVEKLDLRGSTGTFSGAINATGNELNNTLTGNSNSNILNGGEGADDLIGLTGNDTYIVDDEDTDGAGADTGDTVTDSGGTDNIQSSKTFNLSTGNNAGGNTNVENITLTGSSSIGATGNTLNNIMTGNSGANTIDGGAGNDTLVGNGDDDTLTGGTGDDRITGGTGRDVVATGGTTTVGAVGVVVGAEQDTIVFAAGVTDTVATATSIADVDLYSDLVLNADVNDLIDLTVVVANVGTAVTVTGADGVVAGAGFVSTMNTALNVGGGAGFDTAVAIDISAAVVTFNNNTLATEVDDRSFLAVDLDKNDEFSITDFVIEITGSNFAALDVSNFV